MSHETIEHAELGAEMDYPQHERTYHLFLLLARYGAMHIVALLIAMAVGFFTAAGFITSVIVFVLLSAFGYYILR